MVLKEHQKENHQFGGPLNSLEWIGQKRPPEKFKVQELRE